jgi:N-methylhydantoinase A
MPWQQVELLTFRLRATTPKAPFEMRRIESGGVDSTAAIKRQRRAWFDGVAVETTVYDDALLRAGNEFHGPAMIEEATTTVVVPSRYAVRVDEYRNYVMTRDQASGAASTGAATKVGGAA